MIIGIVPVCVLQTYLDTTCGITRDEWHNLPLQMPVPCLDPHAEQIVSTVGCDSSVGWNTEGVPGMDPFP